MAIKVKQRSSGSAFLAFVWRWNHLKCYFLAQYVQGLSRMANVQAMNWCAPLHASKQGSLTQLLITGLWQQGQKVIKKYIVLESWDGYYWSHIRRVRCQLKSFPAATYWLLWASTKLMKAMMRTHLYTCLWDHNDTNKYKPNNFTGNLWRIPESTHCSEERENWLLCLSCQTVTPGFAGIGGKLVSPESYRHTWSRKTMCN